MPPRRAAPAAEPAADSDISRISRELNELRAAVQHLVDRGGNNGLAGAGAGGPAPAPVYMTVCGRETVRLLRAQQQPPAAVGTRYPIAQQMRPNQAVDDARAHRSLQSIADQLEAKVAILPVAPALRDAAVLHDFVQYQILASLTHAHLAGHPTVQRDFVAHCERALSDRIRDLKDPAVALAYDEFRRIVECDEFAAAPLTATVMGPLLDAWMTQLGLPPFTEPFVPPLLNMNASERSAFILTMMQVHGLAGTSTLLRKPAALRQLVCAAAANELLPRAAPLLG